MLKRPEINYQSIAEINGDPTISNAVAEQIEIQTKYDGYISRQQDEIDRLRKNELTKLPIDFNYDGISGLSNEIKQKLLEVKPETIGQASRIPGITPAAVSLVLIYLKKKSLSKSIKHESA
ncbi:hypothetical protein A3757_21900 [Oleiphilus sp. HI0117]|nr:hypothetical protein A3757_21900 [Oleiphilus sp. HI0117]